MTEYFSRPDLRAAVAEIRARIEIQPRIGLILGSGFNPLADAVEDGVVIPYGEIPHFPTATVEGHVGQLILGQLEGRAVVVMQGRAHYYEGYSMAEITFPVPPASNSPTTADGRILVLIRLVGYRAFRGTGIFRTEFQRFI